MSKTRQGTEREYEVRDIYEARGYQVTRAACSRGGADLIAMSNERIVLIQVKKTSKVSKVRAAAVRELLAVTAPWIHEVDRMVWIWVKQAKPGQPPEGWTVLCVHEDGSYHPSREAATLMTQEVIERWPP